MNNTENAQKIHTMLLHRWNWRSDPTTKMVVLNVEPLVTFNCHYTSAEDSYSYVNVDGENVFSGHWNGRFHGCITTNRRKSEIIDTFGPDERFSGNWVDLVVYEYKKYHGK